MAQVILEKEKPFSESLLWKLQTKAYSDFGISAWSQKGVPSYLTSHPLSVKGYVETALAFLKDIKNDQPVTIIDIGSGTGRFAYLFLKKFLPQVNVAVRYIATDISEENLAFIKNHPMMQRFKELETVIYHHSDDKWQRKVEEFKGPVIVVSNYYFDTVPQTLYRVENGELFLGKVTLSVDEEHNTGAPDMISHLECAYSYEPVKADPLIQEYAKVLKHGSFIVPTGGLKTVEFLRKQTDKPLLWLTADQAVCTLSQARNFISPKVAKHGTFSVTVSYHFLHWYFQEYLGGVVVTTENPDPAYAVMTAILNADQTTLAAKAFRDTLNAIDPIDYFRISEAYMNEATLDSIMALIRAGNFDPINTYLFFEHIRSKISGADQNTKDRLVYLLERVRENFYPISKEEGNLLLNLGVLFFELGDYKKALYSFEQSIIFTGPNPKVLLNIASCRDKL